MAHLQQWACQAPACLSCSDLGRAQKARPVKSASLQSTREPEPERLRPGKGMKGSVHFWQFPCRATWSLSSVDLESTRCHERGKPSAVQTLWAPPDSSDICLFAVFLPPHNTDEQVSLNKWPPSPPVSERKIEAKTLSNRGNQNK